MRTRKYDAARLKAHGFDGLCNQEIPCGCLVDDLAPCGEMHEDCRPGLREDVSRHTPCACDGCGTDHWHVYAPRITGLDTCLDDAKNWQCGCGKRCNPGDGEWRWDGHAWTHHHGYPLGHVTAVRRPLENLRAAG